MSEEREGTGDEQLDREVEELEHTGDRVEKHIEETRSDWEAKQGASDVAGAVPLPDEEDEPGEDEPAEEDEPGE